jgi:hypothetical protein
MTEAKLLLLLSALYRIARPAGSTIEYAWQWMIRDGKAGQLPAQGRTPDGSEIWLLPSAWEKIDWATGTLKESHVETLAVSYIERVANIKLDTDLKEIVASDDVEITQIKLPVDHLRHVGMLLPPDAEVIEQVQWTGQLTASEMLTWLVLRRRLKIQEGEWPTEMLEILPAQLELTRARKERLIKLWGWRDQKRELLPDPLFELEYTVIVQPHGDLSVWPPRAPDKILNDPKEWTGITAEGEIVRLYPVLISAAEWMHKVVEHYTTAGTAGAESANPLIELDANRPDWTHFAERANSISSKPDNLAPEEIARVLLMSDLSTWVPEIQPTLREMQEIKRRMVDRLAEVERRGSARMTPFRRFCQFALRFQQRNRS